MLSEGRAKSHHPGKMSCQAVNICESGNTSNHVNLNWGNVKSSSEHVKSGSKYVKS